MFATPANCRGGEPTPSTCHRNHQIDHGLFSNDPIFAVDIFEIAISEAILRTQEWMVALSTMLEICKRTSWALWNYHLMLSFLPALFGNRHLDVSICRGEWTGQEITQGVAPATMGFPSALDKSLTWVRDRKLRWSQQKNMVTTSTSTKIIPPTNINEGWFYIS